MMDVSVPLSGLVSVNMMTQMIGTTATVMVSVPLSGLVSVNNHTPIRKAGGILFPSPYRG